MEGLRSLLSQDNLAGFLVPKTDAFQGEYVAPWDERLEWLTGFTGSAGIALILQDKAVLFVDGRYTTQATLEVNPSLFEVCHIQDKEAWIKKNVPQDAVIGFDPWLHTPLDIKRWSLNLRPVQRNPIDQLWENRPIPSKDPFYCLDLEVTGKSAEQKVKEICAQTTAEMIVLTASDSIAWLLNIRGHDLPFTPIIQGYALINVLQKKVKLFTRASQDSPYDFLTLYPLEDFSAHLTEQPTLVDQSTTPQAIVSLLQEKKSPLIFERDPCILPRALKNEVEVQGFRQAHEWDGIALCRFFHWIKNHVTTELGACAVLENFRKAHEAYKGPSFPTIAGHGAHGAIIHYRPQETTDVLMTEGHLFLLDSGGQYFQGTTDVTRTIALGKPTEEQKDLFTRVLKGHIAIARCRFPKGTTGSQLDALARQFLWEKGVDYDHGTGHGVGHFLNVHEGPQRISRGGHDTTPLQRGMILSNEPGYYREGAFGIRIESLVVVKEEPDGFLSFETLTLAPIDRHLIKIDLLTSPEKEWLNTYHQQVYDRLHPFLDEATCLWLKDATEALA